MRQQHIQMLAKAGRCPFCNVDLVTDETRVAMVDALVDKGLVGGAGVFSATALSLTDKRGKEDAGNKLPVG